MLAVDYMRPDTPGSLTIGVNASSVNVRPVGNVQALYARSHVYEDDKSLIPKNVSPILDPVWHPLKTAGQATDLVKDTGRLTHIY